MIINNAEITFAYMDNKNEIAVLLGNNIKRIIAEKGLKTRIIAGELDIDPATLRKYMNGDFVMGVDKLVKIAKALNVDMNELFLPQPPTI